MSTRERRALAAYQRSTQVAQGSRSRGGGGGGSSARRFKLSGHEIFAPWGWPDGAGKAELRDTWYLQVGETALSIVFDDEIDIDVHSFDVIPNIDPLGLPPARQKRALMDSYVCNHQKPEDLIELVLNGSDTNPKLIQLRETTSLCETEQVDEDTFRVYLGVYEVFLRKAGQQDGETLWSLDYSLPNWSTSADSLGILGEEDALEVAKLVIASMRSCPLCFYNRYWWDSLRGGSDREKPEVRDSYPITAIPILDLNWLVASESEYKGKKTMRFGHTINNKPIQPGWEPKEGHIAVRRGFGYLRTTPMVSSKSVRYRTLEEYREYRNKLSTIDVNALKGKPIKNLKELFSDKYRIEITELVCPVTGEEIVDISNCSTEAEIVQMSEMLHPSPALTSEWLAYPEESRHELLEIWEGVTAVFDEESQQLLVLPVVNVDAPSGHSPRRMRPSDILTRVTREDGYFSFLPYLPEDGLILQDWTEVAGTHPPEYNLPEALGDVWGKLLTTTGSERGDISAKLLTKEHMDLTNVSPEDYEKMLRIAVK